METNSFSEITQYMYANWGLTSDVEDQIYSLKVIEDDVKFLYAKNVFKKSATQDDAVLFLFEKDRIRTVRFLENGSVVIETKLLSAIRKVTLNHKDRGFSILTIKFDDEITLVLDSLADSDHKKWKLQELILDIYRNL